MDTMKSVDIKPNEEMYKFVYLKPCMETKPSQKFEFELINLWKFGIKMLTAVGNSEFRAWHDPLKPSKLSFLSEKNHTTPSAKVRQIIYKHLNKFFSLFLCEITEKNFKI